MSELISNVWLLTPGECFLKNFEDVLQDSTIFDRDDLCFGTPPFTSQMYRIRERVPRGLTEISRRGLRKEVKFRSLILMCLVVVV